METNQPAEQIDLKPYQPYGIPMLKLLAGLVFISLACTAVYELILSRI